MKTKEIIFPKPERVEMTIYLRPGVTVKVSPDAIPYTPARQVSDEERNRMIDELCAMNIFTVEDAEEK